MELTGMDEFRQVEAELNTRWPASKIDPTLERVQALMNLLSDPQQTYPVIHITGTNGKTSVANMVDALLSRIGLRTGRYTSPHLQLVTERISIDGAPISPDRFVEMYHDIAPYLSIVDNQNDIKLSKFEVLTAMAFAAFADAPVDAAVVEVGLGGTWDATNVADGKIAIITSIGIDHAEYLGDDLADIAAEKAGIIKPDSVAIVAEQSPEVTKVLLEQCAKVDATVARLGEEFGVLSRDIAVGGQLLRLQGLGGIYDDIFLPLFGAHQAANAALALAAVEAFFGAGPQRQLDVEAVRDAFATVRSPGRLERVRSAPAVLLDAAHNPSGANALAKSISEEFGFRKVVAVVGLMRDKDITGFLTALEPVVDEIVLTQSSSPRALDADSLASAALPIFGEDRLAVVPRLPDAIEEAVRLAEETGEMDIGLSGAGVIITGSVVTVGEARTLFGVTPL